MAELRHGAVLSPLEARLKLVVQTAVEANGGSDGAAHTSVRKAQTVREWTNSNHGAFPPADCALAMDKVCVAQGKLPPITCAMARELGGVFLPNIDALADEGSLAGMVMQLSKELGDLAGSISSALADGVVSPIEADVALRELDDMTRRQAQLRAALEAIRGTEMQELGK